MKRYAWRQRAPRWLLICLVVWLLGVGTLWLGGPPVLKWQLESRLHHVLGRHVQIDHVRIAPWSMAIEAHGVRVGQAPGAVSGGIPWPLRIDTIHLNAELLASLLHRAPVIDALAIRGVHLDVRYTGHGQWDVNDLLARWAPSPSAATAEPARFSVFNITVEAPALTLTDEWAGVTHRVESLRLDIPFLSNIGARRETVTAPHLSFHLNGRSIELNARSTPFAPGQLTQLALRMPSIDVAPYLAYWPASWPVSLKSGQLAIDLQLDFETQDAPRLHLQGQISVSDAQVAESRSGTEQPLLRWSSLRLEGIRAAPMEDRWDVGAVSSDGLVVWLRRDADGVLNWRSLIPVNTTQEAPTTATFRGLLTSLQSANTLVHWEDVSIQPTARWTWHIDDLGMQGMHWPMTQAATFEGTARWADAPLAWQGSLSPEELSLTLSAEEWPIATVGPYLQPVLPGGAGGMLSIQARLQASLQPALRWTLTTDHVQFSDLMLGDARQPMVRIGSVGWGQTAVSWPERTVRVSAVRIDRPEGTVTRDAQGRWMGEAWRSTRAQAGSTTASPSSTPDWSMSLEGLRLTQGQVRWIDSLPATPVDIRLDSLSATLGAVQLPLTQPREVAVTLDTQIRADDASGRLSLNGFWHSPTAATLDVQAQQLPLHAWVPYAGPALQIDVLRAQANARGALELDWRAGVGVRYRGNVSIDRFVAESLKPREEVMTWDSLQMRDLDLSIVPDTPLALRVSETVLSDYFARVVIDEQGQLNLMHLWQPSGAAAASAGPPPQLTFGPISLLRGQLRFTDRFIQPHYSAQIQDLTGRLGSLSNLVASDGTNTMADLALSGRVQGSATLDVQGRMNPLSSPPALDIRGHVRQLELSPLSAYSQRLTGYGIERGQLSMEVHYQVNPQGQLEASNQIILNQLQLGTRDPNSRAPNLPVRLAVALLADRNGMIDINLPISGSINDPEFRLSAIVMRMFVNLIGKAVTAPFSLIKGAFAAQSQNASTVAFDAGESEPTASALEGLRQTVQLLQDRPAVSVNVIGYAHAEAENDAFRQAQLNELLHAEQRRQRNRQGLEAIGLSLPERDSPAYAQLLTSVFRQSSLPKPRNLIGLLQDVPLADMETLLKTQTPVTEQALLDLAQTRANRIRDTLLELGADPSRVFLTPPRLSAAGSPLEQGTRAELEWRTR